MPLIGGNFVELRDCVFIKGFPSDSGVSVSDVRKYFQERVGECCVQMTALSKDKRWSFITLKFDSSAVAGNAIERFDGKYICGHKVQMSFWRVPKNVAHSGRFDRNSTYKANSRRWDDKSSFEDDTEKSTRHKDDYPREKNNWNARDTVCRNEKEEFSEDPDNFRGYHAQERNFPERYNTSENFSYQSEEYLQDHWSSDGGEERVYPIFDGNCTGWDSDFSGDNENLSKREYYQREEEFPYPNDKDVWQESGVDRDRDQEFVDQDDSNQGHLADYESYPELYEGSVREEECDNSRYAYSERPFEEMEDESPYRGEDLSTRNNSEWYGDREYNDRQDSLDRNQEENQSSFSSFDQTRQWPRWDSVSPSNPTRRRLSDPEVTEGTPKHAPWAENPQSCNKLRDLTGRNPAAFSEERPRPGKWLRNTHRHVRDRGHHSTSPVNPRPKVFGHRDSPLVEDTSKASSEISYNSAHFRRGRCSISPARDRHSNRGSSEEKNADFKLCGTSPGSDRSSYSFNEQGLERRKRESSSYSPNPKIKVPLLRGRSNETGNGGRRGNDLRRSLMLHQQRQYSLLRERDREEGVKHSERVTKTSPDKPDKLRGPYNSAVSSSTTQVTNRKRRKCDDEKRRDKTETTKRRRQTSQNNSDNASTYSDNKSGNSDSTRKKGIKVKSESRKQPPRHQKGKTRQQRQHVTDNSNTKRADRLLNDLAATLAEGNISLRRPGEKVDTAKEDVNSVARKSVGSVRGRKSKSTGQSGQSKSRLKQKKTVALTKENLHSTLDTVVDVKCGKVTDKSWSTVEGASEGEITTPDNTTSQLTVPCSDDSTDQDENNVAELDDSTNLSTENLDSADHCLNVEKSTQPDKVSSDNHDFLEIKKNCTFIVDIFENVDVLEVNDHDFRSYSTVSERKSKLDFIEKVVEESNCRENCRDGQHTCTIANESSDEPDYNSEDFSLFQSHMQENKVYTDVDPPNEMMSANLQHIGMEISPTEENPPQLEVGEETCPPGGFTVNEDGRNELGISVSYISENSCREVQRDISSNNELPMKNSRPEKVLKTSSVNPLEGKGNTNVCQKEMQTNMHQTSHSCKEVDMEFSSDDTLSGVLLSNKVPFNPVKFYNTGNAMVDRGEEEYIMSSITEKASRDVTNTEHKTSEVGNDGFSVNNTETSVCSNEISADASKQAMEEEGCDTFYSGKELCDSNNADIDDNSNGKTDVTSTVLDVHELDDAVNYVKCQEKVMCAKEDVYVLEGAEVTQRDVYDEKDVGHVYNSRSEPCNADGVVLDATSTEQGVSIASVNDTQQVGVSEYGNSNREDDNMKDAVEDVNDIEQEHSDMEYINVTHREEGTGGDISIFKGEENDSENSSTEQEEVCDMENKDVKNCVNNAKQERDSSKNFDFDLISEDQKCDDQEHKVNNVEEGCVTQQEVFCSKDGNPSNNARKDSHGTGNEGVYANDTDLDTESSNIVDAQVTSEILNTEDPRCKESIREEGVHGTTAEGNPIHIGTRYSCWASLEPCHSSAALAQYSPISGVGAVNSSASSLNNSFVDSCARVSHHLVAEDFEPVDMEISSEDEHHDNHLGSSICVNTETSVRDDDVCVYSPSSPTWRSDEHRSPPPKLDISLYSPSHPTNVSSEGDVEQSIIVEDISYEHEERECDSPICDTMEVVCHGEPQNSSRSSEADEETKPNNADSIGGASTSSLRFSSSPKSGTELFQHVSLADDFSETNFPTKDPTQNRNETTNNEKGEKREKDSALCTANPAIAKRSKDALKPLIRCQTRTQSLPAFSSIDAKPKIVYVTAAKTYDFYSDSGAQHKPRIFYATNDKAAGPARSLSMDTTLGKSWTLGKNSSLGSTSTPVYCEQLPALERIPTVEVEKRKEEKDPNGRVEPLFHNGSFISDAPLEPSKDTTEDGDQEVIKISATSNSAGSDTTMLPAIDGADNSTDCVVTASISSVNKESAVFSTNSDGNLLPLGSTPENEMSLVSQTPLELRQKDVLTEHSRSTDRTPSQITEGESNWDTSNLMSCGSDETTVASEVTDERLLASESEGCGFGLDDEGTSLPKSPVQGSSASEVEGGNEKDVQSEFIFSNIQQQVLPLKTVQMLSNSPPRSANKRTHHDSTTEASRPCKVPRKPLKLIIPASQPSNRGVKRTANRGYLGRHSKKTSTCTITRADVDLVPERSSSSCMLGNGSAITELYTCDKDAMIAEKDSSSENGELMCTFSPAIGRMDGSETNSLSMTGSLPPTCQTGNISPLTAHLSPYNQTPTSAENNNIQEQMAQSCDGKESDWVTLKMERLRNKKEEIEQVYKKECHTVVNVVKMLVSNDPRLEGLLQNAVRRSLQEMGQRCVQELVKQARPGT